MVLYNYICTIIRDLFLHCVKKVVWMYAIFGELPPKHHSSDVIT